MHSSDFDLMLFAVLQRTGAGHPFKEFDEVGGIVIAKLVADIGDRTLRGEKQIFGSGYHLFFHNIAGRFTGGKLDGIGKMARVNEQQSPKIFCVKLTVHAALQQIADVLIRQPDEVVSDFIFPFNNIAWHQFFHRFLFVKMVRCKVGAKKRITFLLYQVQRI